MQSKEDDDAGGDGDGDGGSKPGATSIQAIQYIK